MKEPRNRFRPRLLLGLALALCLGPLPAQAQLAPLPQGELELLRAGLPARQELARIAMDGVLKDEKLGEAYGFRARPAYLDDFGQLHVRYEQLYKGVRVWDGMAIVHLGRDGKPLAPTLALRRDLRQSVEAEVPLQEAQARAIAHLDLKDAAAAPVRNELVLYPRLGERIGPVRSKPGEKLNAEDLDRHADYHILAWHIRLTAYSPKDGFVSRDYIVDALDGTIFKSWDSLQTSAVVGTGKSQYNGNPPGPGNVSLNTNSVTSGFEMRDLTRATRPHPFYGFTGSATHNLNHSTDTSTMLQGTIFTDSDNTWGDNANYSGGSTTGDNGQTAAVDAHYGLQSTWDYYKNVHNWTGIDNQGSATLNRIHYGTNYSNAFWSDECFCMTYGDGSGSTKVLTQLDVAGHEMSHGVMANTAGLVYQDEPGGLNEANSDIFGTMVEFFTRGGSGSTIGNTGGNWTLGEQIWATPLRWMYKPSKDGASFDEWTAGMGVMDVHYTSGPMNRAFYFLSQGATTSGDTSTSRLPSGMTGIGNDKAARIWFRAITTYLTAFSLYWDARGAAIRAARDLYGTGSAEVNAVKNAFAGINVGAIAGSDDSDPNLTISGPGTATGSVAFTASTASDTTAVDWFMDEVWWATRTTSPFSLALDSTQIVNGSHSLRARARDAAGNVGQSNLLTFSSANTTEQLVFNPGMESGDFGWSTNYGGTLWYSGSGTNAHSGNYFLWICGFGQTVTNYAYQPITLPASATSLNLSFWLKVTTAETTTSTQFDKLAIRVYDATGTTVLGTLATLSNLDAGPYAQRTYNLMPYKGQDVLMVFWGTEDSSLATSFFVDDVTVTATVPPPIVVTVSPKPVTVPTGGQVVFTAAVTGSTNTAVNWSIPSGGGSLSGSTGASVTYTAPATAGTASVRAASQADTSKYDTATVTIRSRDLSGDGTTDVLDLAYFARAFGATSSSSNWNALCDLNGDGVVDDADVTLFLAGF